MLLADPGYAREVTLWPAGAGESAAWVCWVSWVPEGELVRLARVAPDAQGLAADPAVVAGPAPLGLTGPALAVDRGRALVAWAERGPRGFTVRARLGAGRALTIAPGLQPSVAFARDGRAWIAWRGARGARVRPLAGRGAGLPVCPDPGARRPRLLALPDGGLAVAVERDAGIEVVRLDPEGGARARRLLAHGGVWHHAPDLALGGSDRLWVAWHANAARDDGSGPDVPKWVVVAALDGPRLAPFVPSAPMRDRDLDKRGEDQCLEFPTLVPDPSGSVTIVARGSHCFYRQELGERGWGPLVGLGPVLWGCRGRRAAALAVPDGRLLVARREKAGIEIELQAGPTERGAPALDRAREGGVDAPRRGTSRRPARRSSLARDVFFGDLHQHSAHSDGTGTPDERYRMAREHYGDDFAALSDHESFLGKKTGPGEWGALEEVALRHDDPGRFATVFAYEWTASMYPGPGHKCVYFPRPVRAVLSRDDPRTKDGPGLLAAVRALGGIAFPHHTGWTGADAPSHDPRVQTCWELCSCHGCYEARGGGPIASRGELEGQFIRDNLDRGLRFGLVASSDGHGLLWHHGVARRRDPFRTGLTAVLAPRLSRAAVLSALRARRCYATSGAKIILSWTANAAPMGSVVRTRGPVALRARVEGTAALVSVSVVTNGRVLHEERPDGPRAALSLETEVPQVPGWAYYYLRVVQEDDEMAWSSPIWVERRA